MDRISHDYVTLSPDIRLGAILLDGTQFSLSLQCLEYWKGLHNNAQLCVKSEFYYRTKNREHKLQLVPNSPQTNQKQAGCQPVSQQKPICSPEITYTQKMRSKARLCPFMLYELCWATIGLFYVYVGRNRTTPSLIQTIREFHWKSQLTCAAPGDELVQTISQRALECKVLLGI